MYFLNKLKEVEMHVELLRFIFRRPLGTHLFTIIQNLKLININSSIHYWFHLNNVLLF